MPLEGPSTVDQQLRSPTQLYLEDFAAGDRFELGSWRITQEEILEFAAQFDPQPFHIDPQLAERTFFRGLIASGWHTGGIWMRLYCEAVLLRSSSLGSPGIQEIRWLAPVRPGELLTGGVEVLSVTASARHPERGTVVMRGELRNHSGELKMRLVAYGLFGSRPSAEGQAGA